jgi:hypothetical protein
MAGNGDSNRSSSSLRNNDDNSGRKRNQTATQAVAGSKTTISLQSTSSSSSSLLEAENKISTEIPQNRRDEIYEFMKLFGYKPEWSIVQVHITGFFRKKKYTPREIEQHKTATKRYGGTTFVVIGRTHDPSIMEMVVKPKKKIPMTTAQDTLDTFGKTKMLKIRPPMR